MKVVYLILNWLFGVLFLLSGFVTLFTAPLGALCLIAAAALLLPPIRHAVFSKTNTRIPIKARAICIFILVMAFGLFVGQVQEQEKRALAVQQAQDKAEKAAQLQNERMEYFKTNRNEILLSVREAIEESDYQRAIAESNQYLAFEDKELQQLHSLANEELVLIQNEEKTQNILTELKSIPTEEYERNRKLYKQLLDMHPGNRLYKDKISFYDRKIREERIQTVASEERKKNIKSQFSAWDGSHRNLESVIKKSMNNPDSYDHAETIYWDRGDHLVVQTSFRGTNAFGGVVKNTVRAKVSLDGKILQILSQD